jgi:uncharacterized membrane protein YcgQ (UPF0703/DUF1980 family)
MRRITGLLIIGVLAFTLTACGAGQANGKNTSSVKSVDDVLKEQADKDAGKDVSATEATEEVTQEVTDKTTQEVAEEVTQETATQEAADNTTGETSISTSEDKTEIADNDSAASKAGGIDVDLTLLSSTLVYSEVYNIMTQPDSYIGKKIRIKGTTAVYHDDTDDNDYYACVIKDATACCAQGIEFQLKNGSYPAVDSEITVSGTFSSYDIEGAIFYTLKDAVIE